MRRSQPRRTRRAALVSPVALVAALVFGLSACGNGSQAKAPSTTGPIATVTTVPKTTTTVASQVPVNLYFVRGDTLGVALRMLQTSADPRYVAVKTLVAGPSLTEAAAGLGTDIPKGTVVRGLQIHGGLATINLSPEFVTPGPPASLSARLAQVVYTLTAYPNVLRVAFQVAKLPLTTFAGVNLATPVGRSQVTAALPYVLLESPAVGASLQGSLRLSGLTSFVGVFDIQLTDSSGRLLAAVTNTGVVGATFAQTVPFTTSSSGTGTVRVFARPSGPGQPPQQTMFQVPIVR